MPLDTGAHLKLAIHGIGGISTHHDHHFMTSHNSFELLPGHIMYFIVFSVYIFEKGIVFYLTTLEEGSSMMTSFVLSNCPMLF